jgi:hypothetical protein
MKYLMLVMLLVVTMACTALSNNIKSWSKEDTAWQAVNIALISADWLQTRQAAKDNWIWNNKKYRELNPVFSKHPSVSEVDTLIPLGMLGHTVVAVLLPPDLRRWWQYFFIVVETGAVANNYASGIRIDF